jgi:Peptidase_C39 like family
MPRQIPRTASACLLVVALLGPVGSLAPVASASRSGESRDIAFTRYDGPAMSAGSHRGTVVTGEGIGFGTPTGKTELDGRTYERARWTAPWSMSSFAFTEAVASWSASTPGDSFVEVEVRGRNSKGVTSSWDLLGRWAAGDKHVRRTTQTPQSDDLASVDVDTWKVKGSGGLVSSQLRLSLYRKAGTKGPTVSSVALMTSRLPRATSVAVSTPGPDVGVGLDVPSYSQMAHSGHFPQWGGGGEAWCSPTSTSMVLAYYGALP